MAAAQKFFHAVVDRALDSVHDRMMYTVTSTSEGILLSEEAFDERYEQVMRPLWNLKMSDLSCIKNVGVRGVFKQLAEKHAFGDFILVQVLKDIVHDEQIWVNEPTMFHPFA